MNANGDSTVQTSQWARLFSYGRSVGNDVLEYYIDGYGPLIRFRHFDGGADSGAFDADNVESYDVFDGNDHNVVITWESGGTQKIYVDGNLGDSRGSWFDYDISNGFNKLNLGATIVAGGVIVGTYDEIRIYDKTLSADEAKFLAENPPGTVTGQQHPIGSANVNPLEVAGGGIVFNELSTAPTVGGDYKGVLYLRDTGLYFVDQDGNDITAASYEGGAWFDIEGDSGIWHSGAVVIGDSQIDYRVTGSVPKLQVLGNLHASMFWATKLGDTAAYGYTLEEVIDDVGRYGLKYGSAGYVGDTNLMALTNRAAGGEISFQVNSGVAGPSGETEAVRIKYDSGIKVGVGTEPETNFHLHDASGHCVSRITTASSSYDAGIQFGDSATAADMHIGYDAGNDLMTIGHGGTFGNIASGGIAIDTNGNIGVFTTDIESWSSAYSAIEFPSSAIMYRNTAVVDGVYVVSNAYYDGSWKYKLDGTASYIAVVGGYIRFQVSNEVGTTDAVIPQVEAMRIINNGNIGIQHSTPDKYLSFYNNAFGIDSDASYNFALLSNAYWNTGAAEWRVSATSYGSDAGALFINGDGLDFSVYAGTAADETITWDQVLLATAIGLGVGVSPSRASLEVDKIVGNTSAKFGATDPLFIVSNDPNIGFNAYYNTAWKTGTGVQYASVIGFSPGTGIMTISTTTGTAATDAAVSGLTTALTIDNAQKVLINQGVLEIGNLGGAVSITMKPAATASATMEIGNGRTGSGYAFIDLIGDTTYGDYGLRLIRYDTGLNAVSRLHHRGTGEFQFYAQ
ncbi:MAG: LamG-like jellyroll fold domain-containing protein, partial [Candidatus Kariarchaeaceae archaeon]